MEFLNKLMTRTKKTVLGFAIAVFVCLLLVTVVLAGAATIGWKAAVRAGNETAAIQTVRTIAAIERQYYNTHDRKFGTFEELVNESLLDTRFRGGVPVVDGYAYRLTINQTTSNAQSTLVVTADPQDNSTGNNHFYLDSSSDEIRFNPDQTAGPSDAAWKKQP
jgi:Tfp pilus assembly protein PilE